ncbi:deoxyribose-phosphate aldolase [Saccharata proteae CBS 121410]|uniref:deoxyribose-phosphate aldolase n=1 Tax=Saccharata proteae CBS 121410 TaxID=1314787 RepID=A0A9P4HVK9_9PEZI|nr:deoxyribose-phosphate aldolase [Saccharata proteae CBS 121410]
MTTRYTNPEWAALVDSTEKQLQISKSPNRVPDAGSVAFAKTIDHTLLKLDTTVAQIDSLCDEARRERFATVCVRLNHVARAVSNLKGCDVGVACVVGFHEGTQSTSVKVKEAEEAIYLGASELDIVINYPILLNKDYESIFAELATLRTAVPKAPLKLIIETSQLGRKDVIAATCIASTARFDCVKTSTGFNGRGASVEDVRLMTAIIRALGKEDHMWVKASGGIRGLEDAKRMLEAGAARLGSSSGVWIMQEARQTTEGIDDRPGTTRLYTDNSIGGY